MKLSDTFKHRIIIDRRKDAADCIDACMLFLDTLVLDPANDKRKIHLKKKLQELKKNTPPSRITGKKKVFFYAKIVPLLRDIAPENCYFGRHPNDENLFGYWKKSLLLQKTIS